MKLQEAVGSALPRILERQPTPAMHRPVVLLCGQESDAGKNPTTHAPPEASGFRSCEESAW